jgi:hypothetical protein
MRSVRDPEARGFVEEFAASRALRDGEDDFAEYLWEYGPDDPPWAFSVLKIMLSNVHLAELLLYVAPAARSSSDSSCATTRTQPPTQPSKVAPWTSLTG